MFGYVYMCVFLNKAFPSRIEIIPVSKYISIDVPSHIKISVQLHFFETEVNLDNILTHEVLPK